MSALTRGQVATLVLSGGLSGEAAAIAVAVAQAESGFQYDVVGDWTLMDATWGPSIGLWQIRSIKAQGGTGGPRDGSKNFDPTANMRAMLTISNQGKNWQPWSTFTNGAYLAGMGSARSAIVAAQAHPEPLPSTLSITPHKSGGGAISLLDLAPALGLKDNSSKDFLSSIPLVGGALDTAGGAISTVKDVGSSVAGFLGKLSNVGLWKRAGLMVTGAACVAAGASLIFKLDMAHLATPTPAPEKKTPPPEPDTKGAD